jgi:ABC-2 type transport system permease protein
MQTRPDSRRASLRFAGALLGTSLKTATALRGAFLLSMLFMALNNAIFFVFWWALFERVPSIRGFRVGDVQLLFGIGAAGFGLMQVCAGGLGQLSRLIDEGELDPLLTQPKPTLLYVLGLRSQASGFGDLLSGLAFLALSGELQLARAPLVLLCLLASAAIFASAGVVFFSLAFWLPKTQMLSRQLFETTITFALYPEPLFGGALRLVLFTLLPAGLVTYLPVRVLRDAAPADVLRLCAATLAYVLLAWWVFRRGLRRYASGSRFSVAG